MARNKYLERQFSVNVTGACATEHCPANGSSRCTLPGPLSKSLEIVRSAHAFIITFACTNIQVARKYFKEDQNLQVLFKVILMGVSVLIYVSCCCITLNFHCCIMLFSAACFHY